MGKGGAGQYTSKIKSWISGIMYGNEQHPWGVVIEEKE